MRLAAIFCVWDDWSLLKFSVANIRPLVDGVIVIGSTYSNYKEYSPIPEEWHTSELFVREPHFHIPLHAETDKRNYGLEIARKQGYTHFITMDSDELYKPEDFLRIKNMFHVNPNLQGVVCSLVTYFKLPTLSLGREGTRVTHIHKLTPTIKHEFNRNYPFAWEGRTIKIDPSRSLNINTGVEYVDIDMLHYSWIRSDFPKKIRNSTARANLERSTILEDLVNAKEGYRVQFYDKTLSTAPDYFGLNELLDKNLFLTQSSQPLATANQENKPS
jgi:hypothetical protein